MGNAAPLWLECHPELRNGKIPSQMVGDDLDGKRLGASGYFRRDS